jgi:Flp pilus assembly protein TadD
MLHSLLTNRVLGCDVFAASTSARRADRNAGRRAGGMLMAAIAALLAACTGPSLSLLPADLAATVSGAKPGDVKIGDATSPVLAADQTRSTPAASVLTEARGLRRAGDKKKAFDLIDAAVAKAPAPDRTLLVEGGLLALEIGAPEKAEMFLKKAEDPAKPDWRVLSGLGVAASAQGRHEEARRHFKAALALSPGQPAVLNNLALSHVLERKPGEAEKVLREASKAAPKSARIKQNLALTQGLKGRSDDSGEATESAKTAAPEKSAVSPPRKAAAVATPSWETSSAAGAPVALPMEKTAVQPPRNKVAQSYVTPESNHLGIGASIGD